MDIVKNAVTCSICQSPADLINRTHYQCQQHAGHVGDTFVGIFSDLTHPEPVAPISPEQRNGCAQ